MAHFSIFIRNCSEDLIQRLNYLSPRESHFGEGNGTPLQYSFAWKIHGQRSLVGCSPWGREELDMTERLQSGAFKAVVELPTDQQDDYEYRFSAFSSPLFLSVALPLFVSLCLPFSVYLLSLSKPVSISLSLLSLCLRLSPSLSIQL